MCKFLKRFAQNQSGAVTVDWVVLTAAAVGLGLLAVGTLNDQSVGMLDELGRTIIAKFG